MRRRGIFFPIQSRKRGLSLISRSELVAPDLPGGFDAELELRFLLLDGQVVAVVGAREPALRADAQVLERHELRGLLDSALQRVLRLELGELRRHESENDLLAFGD